MQGNILDGDRWIAERLAFLRGLLEEELSDAQRRAVEDEIAVLSKERGITGAGRRRRGVLHRWLSRRGE